MPAPLWSTLFLIRVGICEQLSYIIAYRSSYKILSKIRCTNASEVINTQVFKKRLWCYVVRQAVHMDKLINLQTFV